MKRKLIISVIIGTLIASSFVLAGCGNSNNTDANTQTSQSQAINQDNSNPSQSEHNATEESKDKTDTNKKNNSSDNDKATNNSTDSPKKSSESSSSQSSKNNDKINKNTNDDKTSNKSDNSSDSSKENSKDKASPSNNGEENNSKVPLKDLADKIADLELGGNVQYITPVKAIGSAENLSYEEDPNSSLFFCSDTKFDSKNLKYGTLVNLFGYNEKTDTYSFIVSSYEFLKNGGSGTIDHGTISSSGKIESGNLN